MAKAVAQSALDKGSHDNTSAVVVQFGWNAGRVKNCLKEKQKLRNMLSAHLSRMGQRQRVADMEKTIKDRMGQLEHYTERQQQPNGTSTQTHASTQTGSTLFQSHGNNPKKL